MPPEFKTVHALMAWVDRHTQERGQKAALAKDVLKIQRQRLNGWISGLRTPDGEATLKLLDWVRGVMKQNKKTGRTAINSATSKQTRSRKSDYEKPKPSPH